MKIVRSLSQPSGEQGDRNSNRQKEKGSRTPVKLLVITKVIEAVRELITEGKGNQTIF